MHQIKNVVINLDCVSNIKQTQTGLEFSTNVSDETLTATGARLSDLVNAIDIETLRATAVRVESECGFRACS